jgi:hypothetical protein
MPGTRKLRARFWVESGLAVITAALAIVTAVTPDWIELVFNVDPDEGSGLLEWGFVLAGIVAVVLLLLARLEWRRSRMPVGESA